MDKKSKVERELPEFVSEVSGLSVQDLERRLATLALAYEELMETKENDQKLKDAKDLAKELNAPYRDAVKALKAKSFYLAYLLQGSK